MFSAVGDHFSSTIIFANNVEQIFISQFVVGVKKEIVL